jgi:hypothetical protein
MDDNDNRAKAWAGYISLEDAFRRYARWRFTSQSSAARSILHALAIGRLEALERTGEETATYPRDGYWKSILDRDRQFPPGPGFMIYEPAFELWLEDIPRLGLVDEDAAPPPPDGDEPLPALDGIKADDQPTRKMSTAAAVTACKDRLVRFMLDGPKERGKKRDDYLKACMATRSDLFMNGAREAWKQALKETEGHRDASWTRSGPA